MPVSHAEVSLDQGQAFPPSPAINPVIKAIFDNLPPRTLLLKNESPHDQACIERIPRPTPYKRGLDRIDSALNQGEMPPLSNGFSVVVDYAPTRRSGTIPILRFTGYFSEFQVGIAASGEMHGHDRAHLIGYEEMLRELLLADLLQSAATQALASFELCVKFGNAADKLSADVDLIMGGMRGRSLLYMAHRSLLDLLDLRRRGQAEPDLEADAQLLNYLWERLGFKYCEAYVLYQEQTAVAELALGG